MADPTVDIEAALLEQRRRAARQNVSGLAATGGEPSVETPPLQTPPAPTLRPTKDFPTLGTSLDLSNDPERIRSLMTGPTPDMPMPAYVPEAWRAPEEPGVSPAAGFMARAEALRDAFRTPADEGPQTLDNAVPTPEQAAAGEGPGPPVVPEPAPEPSVEQKEQAAVEALKADELERLVAQPFPTTIQDVATDSRTWDEMTRWLQEEVGTKNIGIPELRSWRGAALLGLTGAFGVGAMGVREVLDTGYGWVYGGKKENIRPEMSLNRHIGDLEAKAARNDLTPEEADELAGYYGDAMEAVGLPRDIRFDVNSGSVRGSRMDQHAVYSEVMRRQYALYKTQNPDASADKVREEAKKRTDMIFAQALAEPLGAYAVYPKSWGVEMPFGQMADFFYEQRRSLYDLSTGAFFGLLTEDFGLDAGRAEDLTKDLVGVPVSIALAPNMAAGVTLAWMDTRLPAMTAHSREGRMAPYSLTIQSPASYFANQFGMLDPLWAGVATGTAADSPEARMLMRRGGGLLEAAPKLYDKLADPVLSAYVRTLWWATGGLPDWMKSGVRRAGTGLVVGPGLGEFGEELPLIWDTERLLSDNPPDARDIVLSTTMIGLGVAAPLELTTPDGFSIGMATARGAARGVWKGVVREMPGVARWAEKFTTEDPGALVARDVADGLRDGTLEATPDAVEGWMKKFSRYPGVARRVAHEYAFQMFDRAREFGSKPVQSVNAGAAYRIAMERLGGTAAKAEHHTQRVVDLAKAEAEAYEEAAKFSMGTGAKKTADLSETVVRIDVDGTPRAVPRDVLTAAIQYADDLETGGIPVYKSAKLRATAKALGVVDETSDTAVDLARKVSTALGRTYQVDPAGKVTLDELNAINKLLGGKPKKAADVAKRAVDMRSWALRLGLVDPKKRILPEELESVLQEYVADNIGFLRDAAVGAADVRGHLGAGSKYLRLGEGRFLGIRPEDAQWLKNATGPDGSESFRRLKNLTGSWENMQKLLDEGRLVDHPGERFDALVKAAGKERMLNYLAEQEATLLTAKQVARGVLEAGATEPRLSRVDDAGFAQMREEAKSLDAQRILMEGEIGTGIQNLVRTLPTDLAALGLPVSAQSLWGAVGLALSGNEVAPVREVKKLLTAAANAAVDGRMEYLGVSEAKKAFNSWRKDAARIGEKSRFYDGIVAALANENEKALAQMRTVADEVLSGVAERARPQADAIERSLYRAHKNSVFLSVEEAQEVYATLKSAAITAQQTAGHADALRALLTDPTLDIKTFKSAVKAFDRSRKQTGRWLSGVEQVEESLRAKAQADFSRVRKPLVELAKRRVAHRDLVQKLEDLRPRIDDAQSSALIRHLREQAKEQAKARRDAAKGMGRAFSRAVKASTLRAAAEARLGQAQRAQGILDARGDAFKEALDAVLRSSEIEKAAHRGRRAEEVLRRSVVKDAAGRPVISPEVLANGLTRMYGRHTVRAFMERSEVLLDGVVKLGSADVSKPGSLLAPMLVEEGAKAKTIKLTARDYGRLTLEVQAFHDFAVAAEAMDPLRLFGHAARLEAETANIHKPQATMRAITARLRALTDPDTVNFGQASEEVHAIIKAALASDGLMRDGLRAVVFQHGQNFSEVMDAFMTTTEPLRVNVGGKLVPNGGILGEAVNLLTTRPGKVRATGNEVASPWTLASSFLKYNLDLAKERHVLAALARAFVPDDVLAATPPTAFNVIEGGPEVLTFRHSRTGKKTESLYGFLQNNKAATYSELRAHLIHLAEHVGAGDVSHRTLKSSVIFYEALIHAAASARLIDDFGRRFRTLAPPEVVDSVNKILSIGGADSSVGTRAVGGEGPVGTGFQDIQDLWGAIGYLGAFGRGAATGAEEVSDPTTRAAIRKTFELIRVADENGGVFIPRAWLHELAEPTVKTGEPFAAKRGNLGAVLGATANWIRMGMMYTLFAMRPRHITGIITGDLSGQWAFGGATAGFKTTWSMIPSSIPIIGLKLNEWMGLAGEKAGQVLRLPPHEFALGNVHVQKVRDGTFEYMKIGGIELHRDEVYRELIDAGAFETHHNVEFAATIDRTLERIAQGAGLDRLFPTPEKFLHYLKRRASQVAMFASEIALRQRIAFYLEMRSMGRTPQEASTLMQQAQLDFAHGVPRNITPAFKFMLFGRWQYLSRKQALSVLAEPFTAPNYGQKLINDEAAFPRVVDQMNFMSFLPDVVAEFFTDEEQADATMFEYQQRRMHSNWTDTRFIANIPMNRWEMRSMLMSQGGDVTSYYDVEQLTMSPLQIPEQMTSIVNYVFLPMHLLDVALSDREYDPRVGARVADDIVDVLLGAPWFEPVMKNMEFDQEVGPSDVAALELAERVIGGALRKVDDVGVSVGYREADALLRANPDFVYRDPDTDKWKADPWAVFATRYLIPNWLAGGTKDFYDGWFEQPQARSTLKKLLVASVDTLGWGRVAPQSTPRIEGQTMRAGKELIEEHNRGLLLQLTPGAPNTKADITRLGELPPGASRNTASALGRMEEWNWRIRSKVQYLVLDSTPEADKEQMRKELRLMLETDDLPSDDELYRLYVLGEF